jgi:AraC family transcriptional regulator
MHADTHYGKHLISRFRPEQVSQVVTTGLKKSNLVVSRLRCDTPKHGFAEPHTIGPDFSVVLQLRDQPEREFFLDERCVHRGLYRARTTSISNHLERPKVNYISPFDILLFSVPQTALDEIADDQGVARIDNLTCERGVFDETVWHLGQALLPALARPHEISSMYAEHTLLAMNTYFASAFGGMLVRPHPARGALASWQLRRATEMMLARLGGDIALADVAAGCGLSLSYFTRAFKQSTGDPPHRWLLRQRVERAKALLRESRMTLAEVAIACGFADQSHFTRVFNAQAGASPGVWRRNVVT